MSGKERSCTAILPGSYDPMTLGHLDIIRRTAAVFDKVYVALLINPDKNYLFDLETRCEIARAACADIENAEVISDDGMLYMLARRLGVTAIVKGVRNSADFEYEMKMADYNSSMAPEIETLFMPSSDKYGDISSTRVRKLLLEGDFGCADKLLPCSAADIIKKRGYNVT